MEYCLHGVSIVYERVRFAALFPCYATTTLAIRNFAFALRITKYCVNISRIVTNVINVKSSFFFPSSDAWKCFSFISYIQRSFAALRIKLTISEIANEKTHDEQPSPNENETENENILMCVPYRRAQFVRVVFHILLHLSCIVINLTILYVTWQTDFRFGYFLPPAMECAKCWHNHTQNMYT